MKTIKLNNGIEMPMIGYGTWLVKETELVLKAIKTGYRLIDTAIAYDNEKEVGEAIYNSGVKRDELFITTKIPNYLYDTPRKAFEESLTRLNLEYVDLLLCHSYKSDKRVEAYKELEKIYKEGKCKAIGVSNFTIEYLEELLKSADIVPAVNQVECHVYFNQKELFDYCNKKDIVMQAYMPLARGKMGFNDERIEKIAINHSVSVPQVMMRWLIQRGIPIIPKTIDEERMKANLDLFSFELSSDEMEILNSIPEQKAFCSASPQCEE